MATINDPAEAGTIYKINSDYLIAQADEIRTLNGTTATMTPIDMTEALQSANSEVAAQEQKIIEITEMLQGKAMGGSGEDVTAEVTAQTELIADLESAVNALPEAGSGGGSGGGGALDTCTIKVWQGTGQMPMFAYTGVTTVDESGNIGAKPYSAYDSYETNNGGWVVYNNVLCGSAIVVCDIDWMGNQSCSVTGGVELLEVSESGYGFTFRAPTEAGSVGTIKLNV